ncbi:TPM domain-containing protein [Leucobacter sp. USHLN153]|uniref:TPM domain-containing protein n=1 Tax=Leucobacter sp. USHLN153 TaxID=3081268 RepID=UPI00301ACDF1
MDHTTFGLRRLGSGRGSRRARALIAAACIAILTAAWFLANAAVASGPLGATPALAAGPRQATATALAPAVAPVTLSDTFVTDDSDALTDAEENDANARLAAASEETGLDLYVVFVDEFTNPNDRIAWANQTADLNGLGDSQYLLAVSTEGRQYYISSPLSGTLSDNALGRIEERVLPGLREGDYADAITAAAEGLEEEQAAPGRNTAIGVGIGAGVLGIGAAAFGLTRAARKRREKQAVEQDLAELSRTAGSALVAADDAVKSSSQELEFARAEFGDDAVSEFADALEKARAQLLEAFSLQQQLDDAVPDTEAQSREWLQRIIELCGGVDETLDAQAEAFVQLRAIEQNAPAALATLSQRRGRADTARAASEAEVTRLSSSYAPEELAALAGATEQAASLLSFAAERETAASAALGATPPDNGAAALAIREAEASVASAESLQQSITTLGTELVGLETRCQELIAELESDIASARSLPDPDGSVAAAIAETEQQVARARENLSSAARRPSQAVQALDAANTRIDGVVHAAQETARARGLLEAQFAQAAEQVRQAETFIDARRGAIGATARTRASEARAALSRADAARVADPRGALGEAQRASALAAESLSYAQADLSGYGGYGGGYGSGYNGGYRQGGPSGGDLGAVLGGILGSGGFGGYGGSGGGFWGSGSGGSWGGGSARRSGGSSWGGSSRRSGGSSRRSSGRSSRRGGGRF